MELSLIQIALLIELTDKEIKQLKQVIDNPSSADDEVDDCGELSTQYIALESALAALYKSKWSKDCGQPSYEELAKKYTR
ncbi:hypothetical protein FKG94_28295 [Exilibacterium tricleocarpae]|uniref:Uncharacterized protein n=1 Tax=Exilibacterium tricleocarpae TaxID=2591008 RepID=A0A545SL34_9GAMM|nr:hypothetical protein [Exilibacterium tricleocarpae]TQV65678.1 hypothetical protein FKG94_28295 [Exilibacterium tricleocarpae]